mmetsp:Transcript_20109/g.62939  ORF Transcript_20109/g.62939 Transcript_20109/m.62939 type:complete len:205 (+) Transcript_20109:882-1496(+)
MIENTMILSSRKKRMTRMILATRAMRRTRRTRSTEMFAGIATLSSWSVWSPMPTQTTTMSKMFHPASAVLKNPLKPSAIQRRARSTMKRAQNVQVSAIAAGGSREFGTSPRHLASHATSAFHWASQPKKIALRMMSAPLANSKARLNTRRWNHVISAVTFSRSISKMQSETCFLKCEVAATRMADSTDGVRSTSAVPWAFSSWP